ncbi:phosphonopyruvate decarboxylase [Candidatus Uhrbacteria bacterium RIFCSPLOWO2_01_FULL_47_24]|uniref:Phosphonopyruvate decarboxylase n=1 Tax=Candidatus Uhrbacteria bacterium RIFCSPLOWO2_01_FULL_47_24 TaxID=1802401 RepID=A0A1F7USP0_9BACT|nr:MAG: phosphonopyruvate decarboxylase [Candidatus Uhrbacteria bacterium RIFCSPHIGHO2_02_FULL_46_47]OGL75407.1 MAG: phosphonopyruvate decarboxylase [Candidatus Uhrbacteria bacterium RIFCSPHIGHO2_12_FULL_47_11]OGL81310.1 MAG: phosphonopyruvate decarboxylase [Candidatus Uhrbacteria bacterium RIFCSPLOWO2_01_FULL_47_24]OGL83947.1 MAG: phosphonopyruvate decarboxylase [Candidatus Uhrbacteria bacterium RIFCSPLOWO2_02_FULL_46_25]OGL91596.1 MAG: phosphonopyruvate decarboxylase [Candidatus Uhrbacteria b
MISPKDFVARLRARGINFFTGVPDSLLKEFCAAVSAEVLPPEQIIAANEGNAIALAAGHYLATGQIALVYLQNAGQGNTVNPLTSLTDPKVYGIPMLLLIGWRGQPGVHDEPQHLKPGEVTIALLEILGIPFEILPSDPEGVNAVLAHAFKTMRSGSQPYALVVRKGTFATYRSGHSSELSYEMTRENALQCVVDYLKKEDVIVSTTGMTSRELYECREAKGQGHSHDFLTVGSMGHSSSIALGIALAKPDRQVYCIDGDGALIMHMGALAVIGAQAPGNFKHVIINNGAHDSVGGQPTVGFMIDIPAIARACGYKKTWHAETKEQLYGALEELRQLKGPCLLEVRVRKGARANLGRPTTTPQQNKMAFMKFLRRK